MRMFQRIQIAQWVGYFFTGFFIGWSLIYLEPADAAIAVGLGALVMAVSYWVANILHELVEINDQLAGRSPEFGKLMGGGVKE